MEDFIIRYVLALKNKRNRIELNEYVIYLSIFI